MRTSTSKRVTKTIKTAAYERKAAAFARIGGAMIEVTDYDRVKQAVEDDCNADQNYAKTKLKIRKDVNHYTFTVLRGSLRLAQAALASAEVAVAGCEEALVTYLEHKQ